MLKSKKSLLGGILLFLFMLPSGLGFGLFLKSMPFWADHAARIETLSLFASVFFALDVLMSLSGGTMAHQSEIDFILPTEIKPRQYYLGDLLFLALATNIFLFPFVLPAYIGIVISHGLGFAEAVALLVLLIATVAMGMVTIQALGLWKSRGGWPRTTVVLAIFAAFLLPALYTAGYFPVGYSQLPYPSTAVAVLGEALIMHTPLPWSHQFLFLAYGLLITFGYYHSSGRYGFHRIKATMVVSFGQPSFQRQAVQQQKMIVGLGKVTRRLRLTTRGTPLFYFTKLHFVRIARDGSLLMVALFFTMFLIIGVWTARGSYPSEPGPLMGPLLMSAFIPVLLAFNWLVMERDNLWLLVTSGTEGSHYFRALFICFSAISILLPALTMAIGSALGLPTFPILGLAGFVYVLVSSATAIGLLTHLNIPRTSISLNGMALFLVPMLFGALAAGPLLGLGLLNVVGWIANSSEAFIGGVVYASVVALLCYVLVGPMGRSVRLEGL